MSNEKLNAKDFITVGVFTAIIFVVEFVCGMLGFIHPYVVASYVVLMPLIACIPMMLFYTKVNKFGMITIMAILSAILWFLTGMGYLGAPLIVLAGVVADLIAKSGDYKSFKKTVLSHGVYCLWICGNFFPVVITATAYRQRLLDGGYSQDYADNLFRAVNSKTIFVLAALCFVFGCIGALLGKVVLKKHFEKAGIV
ncbi:MAG: MptD family putative ECF transporter S component [Spirochaetaceae bacterium]|nr:MptD family putative ECF transporter S component [Spirochaetaceae bacterium]